MLEDKVTITFFLWNEPHGRNNHLFNYDARYANIFVDMVDRCLNYPHDFVCVTDIPEGINKKVKIVPLPRDMLLPRSRFPKLLIFHPEAESIFGKLIWSFDLDTVLVKKLDPLLDRMDERGIVLWQNPNWGLPKRTRYNSSTVLLKAGTKPHIWNNYKKGIEKRDDQDWMTKNLADDEACWTGEDGIYWSENIKNSLPANARIVTFAGKRGPSVKAEQEIHPWIKDYWY